MPFLFTITSLPRWLTETWYTREWCLSAHNFTTLHIAPLHFNANGPEYEQWMKHDITQNDCIRPASTYDVHYQSTDNSHNCRRRTARCSASRLTYCKLEALGQCVPPPRHVLPVSRYQSCHLANRFMSVNHFVVGRRCNDVIVAMAMPASACPALQRRRAQSVDTTFRISQ